MNKNSFKAIVAAIVISLTTNAMAQQKDFNYVVDRFADIEVLRYKVPDFENLSLNQKLLVYNLTEAALAGRDILWDQNGKFNLAIRDLIENIYKNYKGDRNDPQFLALEKYLKQIWFANGIYHHYSMDKFTPEFSKDFLKRQINLLPADKKPADKETQETLVEVITNPYFVKKKVNQAEGEDLILTSATNLYDGVTQREVEEFYSALKDTTDTHPVMYGLNRRVTKDPSGKVIEQVYRLGGLYSPAIEKIISHLEEALKYAENPQQAKVISELIKYYKTGDLRDFDTYSISWVGDTDSRVDFINGFIESYDDPLGMTANFESIVNFKNLEASHRTETLSDSASWFEAHSPVDPRFRKDEVKGVTAKVITAAILAGDAYPATPIGINLPNSNWIRAEHGSKSVTIENITQAYDEASHGNGFNDEFIPDAATRELIDNYLFITDNLHTDLHECLGHASGRLLPGVDPDALKAYGSTLEEARADLFALYYLADPKMIELGLISDPDAYKAQYYKYLLNGLMTQLMRIEPGKNVEEAHMRNRKLISEWVLEKGASNGVLSLSKVNGKTTLTVNDYPAVRELFGQLLGEIQRIKSEGDYEAGKNLVETYGVKVDPQLHNEILERYSHLSIAPYKGFVNPVYTLVVDNAGNPVDVTVAYDEGYIDQMFRYSDKYSTLPR
ncbi:MAG: dihydrofolate reductase [Paramuribaculum sp.]|nr:dihydrofolate reductase [Paramuribaculum sp.]